MATSITTIQSTDLITNSRADINNNFDSLLVNKIETDVLTTDSTFATASDSKIPSQLAVKQYVDAGGNVNASTTAKGIVELATAAEIDVGTATGATGAALVVTAEALKGSLAPIVRVYENSGSPHTWSKPAGLKYIVVEGVGGGASGGSGYDADTNDQEAGAGGGAGGYFRKVVSATSLGTTETVTVGAGGASPAVDNNGNGGGTTSFGSHCSATGGASGASFNSDSSGSAGGVGSNGDVNMTGGKGGWSMADNNQSSARSATPGDGGASYFGGAGAYGSGSDGGQDGQAAAGTNGIVILTEYYV